MSETNGKKTAGAFDVRNIIGALLTIYGVILLLVGLFNGDGGPKSGDVNSNLWAGIVLLVVGLGFLAWARVRPVTRPANTSRSRIRRRRSARNTTTPWTRRRSRRRRVERSARPGSRSRWEAKRARST